MPGFSIFSGDLVSEEALKASLQNYSNTKELTVGDQTIELIDRISSYHLKENRTISFIYHWDKRMGYQYRGETKFQTRTFSIFIRILRNERNMFFLLQIIQGTSHTDVIKELRNIIYKGKKDIKHIDISSLAINQIETEDSRITSGEAYRGLSPRDKTMVLFGSLNERLDNGSFNGSEMHDIYNSHEKSYAQFLSLSRGCVVYISGKKSSVSLKDTKETHITLDDVEDYIVDFIIPRIAPKSSITPKSSP
jgi:hypothetical protein